MLGKKKDLEKDIILITSNDRDIPETSKLNLVAEATHKKEDGDVVMKKVWDRIAQKPKDWKIVFKVLNLIEKILRSGSERCIDEIRANKHILEGLLDFKYTNSHQIDCGVNVREKAKDLLEKLSNNEMLQSMRAEEARLKERMRQGVDFKSTPQQPPKQPKQQQTQQPQPHSSGVFSDIIASHQLLLDVSPTLNKHQSESGSLADVDAHSSVGEKKAEKIVEEFISETAANNVGVTFTAADFRREFEEVFDRKATPVEITLFLRKLREVRINGGDLKKVNTNIGNVSKASNRSEDLGLFNFQGAHEFESYLFKRRIGGGAYGNVFVGQNPRTGAVRALKIISFNRNIDGEESGGRKNQKQRSIDGEMKIGTEFGKKCRFLVNYEQVTVRNNECFILMEFYAGGDLGKLIDTRIEDKKPFTQEEILRFLVEMGLALQTLHTAGVVHRDIKPQNIFLTEDGSYVLGDYGTARFLSENNTMSMAGTGGYTAPEVLEGDTAYSTAVDVYSLGCVLFEMLELHHPFKNQLGNLNIISISMGKHNAIKSTQYPYGITDLVLRMISVDPSKRPSVAETLAYAPLRPFLQAALGSKDK